MIEAKQIEAILPPISGNRAGAIRVKDGAISLLLDVTGLDPNARIKLEADVRDAITQIAPDAPIKIMQTAERVSQRLIAIASGKGGVGKSTLSTNLAVAMKRQGRAVGLVDADIYGPSQPRLFGREDAKPESEGKKL